jgi:Protein of unknown function (DUF4230)
MAAEPAPPGTSTRRSGFFPTLIAGILLGAIAIAIISKYSGPGPWGQFWSALLGRGDHYGLSQPTVVNRIQKLQRLETVIYTMDKIVTGERENPFLPNFLAGDRILLLVHGEVVAGIDFGNLKSGDVSIQGKNIRLRLPQPQLFSTRLDSDKTRVYSRQTGLLVPVDPNLESRVRQEAEHQLQQSALQDGILRTAQQNARSTITSMLTGLGFEKIDFD